MKPAMGNTSHRALCCWWQVRVSVTDEQDQQVFTMKSASLLDAIGMLTHSAQICLVRSFST
jgi:hypothetical protein